MESLLNEIGSCGRFQTLLILSANIPKILFALFMLFMSFGNYNPGWRCLDNNGTSFAIENDTSPQYTTGNCQLHESCHEVEYDPSASTIVTEWNLACGRSWISSIISSSQMIGILIGAYFTGYIGDKFGRKFTLLGAILVNVVLNLLIIFSTHWPMYVVLKILSGMSNSAYRFLPLVYCTEFVSSKWRVAVASFPFYGLGAILFAVLAMVTKDWRQIHIIVVCATAFSFIIMLWLPRSIRWLATHEKKNDAFKAAKKVAKLNRRPVPSKSTVDHLISICIDGGARSKKYTIKDLFQKGVKLYTFMITIIYFTIGLTFYVISFGIKSLPGNLYTNLIIVYSVALCANASAIFLGNRLGRRKSHFLFFLVMTFSLFGVVTTIFTAPDKTESKGILALALIARASAAAAWYISTTVMNELFPTVIRGTINGWANLSTQTGASVAPFLVPREKDLMYVSYLVMALLNLVCTFFYFLIPETTGNQLQDTWKEVVVEDSEPEEEKSKIKCQIDDVKTKMTNNVELIESQLSPLYTNI